MQPMSSSRPYLLRAIYDWIVDNGMTPHIVVNAEKPEVEVPEDYVQDNQIVLNLAPRAIKDLIMDNDAVEFNARFQGVVHHIYVPVPAVEAIYANENGRGIMFDETFDAEEGGYVEQADDKETKQRSKSKKGKPNLKVIK